LGTVDPHTTCFGQLQLPPPSDTRFLAKKLIQRMQLAADRGRRQARQLARTRGRILACNSPEQEKVVETQSFDEFNSRLFISYEIRIEDEQQRLDPRRPSVVVPPGKSSSMNRISYHRAGSRNRDP
jgi:hypothetical protein